MGNLIGIAGGGFLGLAAGYYLLNFFGGPRYDFLHIPLPRVAHTQPGWVNPERQPAAESPDKAEPASSAAALSSPSPIVPIVPEGFADSEETARPDADAAPTAADPPATAAPDPLDGPTEAAATADEERQEAAVPAEPGPAAAPRFTVEDLNQALAAVQACLGCPACNSTGYVQRAVVIGTREVNGQQVEERAQRNFPCAACQGRPSTHVTQEAYLHLCRLAEVATFVSLDEGEASLWSRKEALRQALVQAAGDQENASSIGRLAGHRLASRQRGENGVGRCT
jgi:hypothetical protein